MTTTKKPRARKKRAEKPRVETLRPVTVADMPPIRSVVMLISNEEMLARYPAKYEKGVRCAICSAPLTDGFSKYRGAVCSECDSRALNSEGDPARHISDFPESIEIARTSSEAYIDFGDGGDNPVFIDGQECRRRYRYGGWVTMKVVADTTGQDVKEA